MSEQNHSAEIGELVKALIKVQAQMQPAKKKSYNPFHKSKYADLVEVRETYNKLLTDNGFATIQATRMAENGDVCVITTLVHVSQQWWSGELCAKPTKIVKNKESGEEKEVTDPQILGSIVSYLRRYGISSLIGVVSEGEDDDAEAATKPHRTVKPEPQELARTGQIYDEKTNNLIEAFKKIGVGKGEIEDILKHDLTKLSEDEKDMLRGIYAEKIKEKKVSKPRSKKEMPDAAEAYKEGYYAGKAEPITDALAQNITQRFIDKIHKPHLEYCRNELGWDNITIEGWYRGKGIEDPSTLNDVELAEIMKQLEVEKKCQPFPTAAPV